MAPDGAARTTRYLTHDAQASTKSRLGRTTFAVSLGYGIYSGLFEETRRMSLASDPGCRLDMLA